MGKGIVKLYVFFHESAQILRLLGNLIALEVRNLKESWQALVKERENKYCYTHYTCYSAPALMNFQG
jgi:hypothetical protein